MNLIISFVGNLDCIDMFASACAYISVPEENKVRCITSVHSDIIPYETGITELTLYDVYQVDNYKRIELPTSFFERHDINFNTLTSDELQDCEIEAIPLHAAFENPETREKIELNLPDLSVYLDARFVVHSPMGMSAEKFIDMVSDINTPYDTLLQFPLTPNNQLSVSGYVKGEAIGRYYYDTETTLKELVQYVVDHPDDRNPFDIYPYFFTEGEFLIAKITFDE